MMVLTQLWLILNALLEVDIIIEQPAEHCLLNLLIILLLEELIAKELDRTCDEQLSSPCTLVKGSDWSIGRETDWSTRKNCYRWFSNVDSRSIRINKL